MAGHAVLAFFCVVASSQILPHLFHGKDNAFPAYKKEFRDLLITELFFISITILTISYLLSGYVHFCCSSSGKNGNILSNGDDTILPFLSIEEADLGNNVCSGSIVISQIMTPGEANTSAIVSFNTSLLHVCGQKVFRKLRQFLPYRDISPRSADYFPYIFY